MNLKNKIFVYLTITLFASFITTFTQAQTNTRNQGVEVQKKSTQYIVKLGDTVYSIARQFGVSVNDIYAYNEGTQSGIRTGQTLLIPNIETKAEETPIKSNDFSISTPKKTHTIKAKETLFSVSKEYKINVTDLINANENLSEETFKIDRVIVIPSGQETYTAEVYSQEDVEVVTRTGIPHKVEAGETLYSISKTYSIGIEDLKRKNPFLESGLKEGTTIIIPYLDSSADKNYLRSAPGKFPTFFKKNDNVLRIGLLLPFSHGTKQLSSEKIAEYYEGFLLSIKKMKQMGLNAEIYTFDIGNETELNRLDDILETNELNTLDIIIGGVSETQVRVISNFSRRTGVKYVVPFTNKNTGVEFNPNLFQVINSHAAIYKDVVQAFALKYANYNIVFLQDDGHDDKASFVQALKDELILRNMKFVVAPATPSITDDLQAVISAHQASIVIMPTSLESRFKRVADGVSYLNRKNYDISLFGYPEWQTFDQLKTEMHNSNTTIFSLFYLSETPQEVAFTQEFKTWYNKPYIFSTPKYAHMGYDVGMYFIMALAEYGENFAENLNKVKYTPLQTAFYFKKAGSAGGYVNNGVFFVNYMTNGDIKRSEIR